MNQNSKKKKFKPKKIPRYLTGQVDLITAMGDLKIYNEHKFRVFQALPQVDDAPPKMNPFLYLKISNLLSDAYRLKQIDKENKKLIQKINIINRTRGNIDSYNPIAYANLSKWYGHHTNMVRIFKDNKAIYNLIKTTKSTYSRASHNEFWKLSLAKIEHTCKYPLVALFKDDWDKIIAKMPSLTNCNLQLINPKCFMDFQIKDGPRLGRIIIELYENYVPVTVQNFTALCKGHNSLGYLHSHVHKIVPGKYIELGDITKGSGRGGKSIFGDKFYEENYMLKHTRPGVVSMIRVGNKENNSMFSITYAANPDLDYKRVAFGKVISGFDVLFGMEGMSRKFGKPMPVIYISNCGEYIELAKQK